MLRGLFYSHDNRNNMGNTEFPLFLVNKEKHADT